MNVAIGSNNQPIPKRQDRKDSDVAGKNLADANRALVGQLKQDTLNFIHHPLASAKGMVRNMMEPLLHPVAAGKAMIGMIRKDPLDGSVNAINNATGTACVAGVIVAGLATLAAPLTCGASLAVAGSALAVAEGTGLASMAMDVPDIAIHEVRAARSRTDSNAVQEGQTAASSVEDFTLAKAGDHVGMGIEHHPALNSHPTQGRLANNTVGVIGIYQPVDNSTSNG